MIIYQGQFQKERNHIFERAKWVNQ